MSSDKEDGYELVMPFVVCTSEGGPYEDSPFVAGVHFGQIYVACDLGTPIISRYVPTGLVPQLDLAAMHFGYTFEFQKWEDNEDDWTLVTLTKKA